VLVAGAISIVLSLSLSLSRAVLASRFHSLCRLVYSSTAYINSTSFLYDCVFGLKTIFRRRFKSLLLRLLLLCFSRFSVKILILESFLITKSTFLYKLLSVLLHEFSFIQSLSISHSLSFTFSIFVSFHCFPFRAYYS